MYFPLFRRGPRGNRSECKCALLSLPSTHVVVCVSHERRSALRGCGEKKMNGGRPWIPSAIAFRSSHCSPQSRFLIRNQPKTCLAGRGVCEIHHDWHLFLPWDAARSFCPRKPDFTAAWCIGPDVREIAAELLPLVEFESSADKFIDSFGRQRWVTAAGWSEAFIAYNLFLIMRFDMPDNSKESGIFVEQTCCNALYYYMIKQQTYVYIKRKLIII